jgi:hypothetical protein
VHRRLASAQIAIGAGVVLSLACLLAIASGVAPLDVGRFVAFHLIWVLGPGILAARVLLRRRLGVLWSLVIGWGLGYALEIGAFAVAAQAGRRDLFLAWPAVAGVAGLVAEPLRRRRGTLSLSVRPMPRGVGAVLAIIAAFLIVHVAAVSIDEIGMPSTRSVRTYSPDFVWDVALAAEARFRWPIRDPEVDAAPLPYHLGWSIDAAATSYVTGIELPVVISRLQPIPLILALVLGFALAGVAIFGSFWAGPVGLAIVLLAGDSIGPIQGVRSGLPQFLTSLTFSPSFLLGIALFIPALLLLNLALESGQIGRRDLGLWVALVVVLCGCAVSKSVLLPILAPALVLLTLAVRAWEGVWDRRALCASGLVVGVLVLSAIAVYAGAGNTLTLRPLHGLWTSRGVHPALLAVPLALVAVPASLLATVGAPLIGARWMPWPPSRGAIMLLCVTLVSAGATFVFWDSVQDQVYFLHSGLVAGGLLAGAGVAGLWSARAMPRRRQGRVVVVVLVVLGVELASAVISHPGLGRRWLALALLAVGWVGITWKLLRRGMSGYVLPLAITTIVLAAATLQPSLAARELKLLTGSHDNLSGGGRLRVVDPSHGGPGSRLAAFDRIVLPPGVEAGLTWIRGHTRHDAALVVPDVRSGLEVLNDWAYAAFSERRTVMSGTLYTSAAASVGYDKVAFGQARPFARLQRLQAAVYADCDRRALTELIDVHHASHLLIDRTSGPMQPCLSRLGGVLFDDGDLAVVRLRPR